ncbi:MAG: hypothetical protein Q4C01_07215 [Clostridia bacterium]|nr:hypothetical protein [Clostridia bacterium]
MAYTPTGLQAMYPIYFARTRPEQTNKDEYNGAIAQNENNLNQNLALLYNKIIELEAALAEIQ